MPVVVWKLLFSYFNRPRHVYMFTGQVQCGEKARVIVFIWIVGFGISQLYIVFNVRRKELSATDEPEFLKGQMSRY